MRKRLTILCALCLVFGFTATNATAGTWEVQLGDAYEAGDYWAYDISFIADETVNLTDMNLSFGFDTADVAFSAVQYYEYDDGAAPFANDTWVGGMVPYNDTEMEGLVFDIQGQQPLGVYEVFYPGQTGQTLIYTLYFEEVDGASFDDSSVYLTYGSDLTPLAVEAVNVDGERYNNHDLNITANSITLASAVPVPGAVWLLGSGMLGIIGLRSRNRRQ